MSRAVDRADSLSEALRHYAWLCEANTTGRVGRTPEAWDAAAARLEAGAEGLTGDERRFVASRARDARANAAILRLPARAPLALVALAVLALAGACAEASSVATRIDLPTVEAPVEPPPPTVEPPPPVEPAGLLLTEIVLVPSSAELIEIANPTGDEVDLADYVLTDSDTLAGSLAAGAPAVGLGDFAVRFPAGATIAPGEVVVVAIGAAADYAATYGPPPTFALGAMPAVAPSASPNLTGEAIALVFARGARVEVVDLVSAPAVVPPARSTKRVSARMWDSAGAWSAWTAPDPGKWAPRPCAPTIDAIAVGASSYLTIGNPCGAAHRTGPGWSLVWIDAAGADPRTVALNAWDLAPGGEHVYACPPWLAGGVALRDASGAVLDRVGYGTLAADHPFVEGSAAPALTWGARLVRAGPDTDVNAADFVVDGGAP